MKVIFKYPLNLAHQQHIALPKGCRVLDIQQQNGQYYLWALVDTDQPTWNYSVVMLGTGDPIPDFLPINASAFNCTTQDGPFVWHWFVLY